MGWGWEGLGGLACSRGSERGWWQAGAAARWARWEDWRRFAAWLGQQQQQQSQGWVQGQGFQGLSYAHAPTWGWVGG